jgi:hypothetical protein
MTVVGNLLGQAGLPSEDSTKSYWHTPPNEKLLGYRSTKELPDTADVVVVGSGITGTFAARELVNGGKEVLLLEAREACWGATGRVSFFLRDGNTVFGVDLVTERRPLSASRLRIPPSHCSFRA